MSADTDKTTIDQTTASRGHGPLERVTVNLTPRSSRALNETVERNGDTKTDTINRALQIYAFIEEIWHNGGSVYVRQQPDAELELIRAF
jgi:hypothetical protein